MKRRQYLEKCPADLRDFLTALSLTGARPQEIAAAKVEDFERFSRKLVLRHRKGYQSRLKTRDFSLANDAAFNFFVRMVSDKLPQAPLMTRNKRDGSVRGGSIDNFNKSLMSTKTQISEIDIMRRRDILPRKKLAILPIRITNQFIKQDENSWLKVPCQIFEHSSSCFKCISIYMNKSDRFVVKRIFAINWQCLIKPTLNKVHICSDFGEISTQIKTSLISVVTLPIFRQPFERVKTRKL